MSSPDPQNTYMIDIEEGAETGRLMEQDRLFTTAMGGLFPEQKDLSGITKVLDIACGPGGWALEVAYAYPEMEVIGVDINETMIRYAFAQARSRKLQNVSFEVMNIREPLTFQDNSFDLINGRLLVGFMDATSWPLLVAECERVLRPGGILRLTEAEINSTSSAALQRLYRLMYQIIAMQKRSFSVDGYTLGLISMLKKLLEEAGFEKIGRQLFCIDASAGEPLHYSSYKDIEVLFILLKPYILASGLIQEEEFDRLYQQALIDGLGKDFLSLAIGMTAWGKKASAK